ncbi:hypothetical protein JCM19297_240 [Nonlabens ulvanivorans]|nr:hypothetical protein JCM19297_240 [Nonlabens ulvanivorans]
MVLGGIEAIEKDQPIDANSVFINKIVSEINTFDLQLNKLGVFFKRNGLKGLSDDYNLDLKNLFDEVLSVGEVLSKIVSDENIEIGIRKYWVAKLTLIMPEIQDLPILRVY